MTTPDQDCQYRALIALLSALPAQPIATHNPLALLRPLFDGSMTIEVALSPAIQEAITLHCCKVAFGAVLRALMPETPLFLPARKPTESKRYAGCCQGNGLLYIGRVERCIASMDLSSLRNLPGYDILYSVEHKFYEEVIYATLSRHTQTLLAMRTGLSAS